MYFVCIGFCSFQKLNEKLLLKQLAEERKERKASKPPPGAQESARSPVLSSSLLSAPVFHLSTVTRLCTSHSCWVYILTEFANFVLC